MKPKDSLIRAYAMSRRPRCRRAVLFVAFAILALPSHAHASLFHGETLDSIANGISWFVLIIAPIIGITLFWLVHILPEKIAHKRKHPQTRLVQCLCLMSLVFGGILWVLSMTLIGYFLGQIPGVREHIEIVILVVIFLSILPGIIAGFREWRKNRRAQAPGV